MDKILIAGATGYLGGYVAKEFKNQNYFTRLLVRNTTKLEASGLKADEIITAEITDKKTLHDCCKNIDIVFSSIGITKQKDGFTYLDVDYKGNVNLLEEAKRCGVKKFIYVSVLNGDKLRNLKICEAKEKFVDDLKKSGMDYCIICPTGYFSDMAEFYKMAEKGNVFLFGKGDCKMNPIDGKDLAGVCVDAVQSIEKEIACGGPEIFSYNQIATTAFSVAQKKKKITHIPDWLRKLILWLLRTFTSSKTYGPIEFFMTVLSMDMVAPEYGDIRLKEFFEESKNRGES